MALDLTDKEFYLKLTTPFGKDKLIVRGVSGEERISALFRFQLDMVSEERELDFATIIGKSVTLTVERPTEGEKRYINGLVSRFVQSGSDDRLTTYHAEVVPWPWMLTLTADCRIFQNKKAPDIIKKVFDDLAYKDYKDSLTKTYGEREYCVQYRETAFDFVSRLMEEEGIFYFFEHADGKHTLVLADDADAHKDCPGAATVPLQGTAHDRHWETAITGCMVEERVTTGKWAADDYNFETPSTQLFVKVDGENSKMRVYDYPGGYLKKDAGETIAKVRQEAFEAPIRVLSGESTCQSLAAGFKFKLDKHPRKDLNDSWVLRAVRHTATLEAYVNTFEAFPAKTPFRPVPATRRPIIPGTQTAKVVGKSGEEIWTDKYGRIKVQFHWDQEGKSDETSSCWIRVAHNWAGKAWGAFFLPRIGMEVVVSFLEGDPDRPLVTGAVYNAEQTVPYGLPDNQTRTLVKTNSSKGGGGYNELRFEDKKDSEEIWVHAQKDYNIKVENDRKLEVLHDETTEVTNDRKIEVKEGNETHTVTKGNFTHTVSAGNQTIEVTKGNETYTIAKGKRDVSVKDNETHTNDANFDHTVKGNYTLTIKGNLTIKADGDVKIEAGKSMSLKAGTTFKAEAGTSLTTKAGTALTDEAGTALTSKAGTSWTGEAGTSLTAKGGISATVKGSASGTVDGGGMLTVKGGLVKIN